MRLSGRIFLLAALAGPALAGSPPSPPQAGPAWVAADLAPLIEAHRALAAGSGVLPLRLAPAPVHNGSSDARCSRVER